MQLLAYGLTAAMAAVGLVSGATTHIKGHLAGTSLGSVTYSYQTSRFSVAVTDNVGSVTYKDGRKVDVVVVYPGKDKLGLFDYDATYGYYGNGILALGADAKGLFALWTLRQDGENGENNEALTANSDGAVAYNIDLVPSGTHYQFKQGSGAGLDLDISVPLATCADCKCPTVTSNDGQFTLQPSCVGKIGGWQMTVFHSLPCPGCRPAKADFVQVDALLVKDATVCYATIFATVAGADTHPITVVPFCFGGSWPAELNHFQGTVSPLNP